MNVPTLVLAWRRPQKTQLLLDRLASLGIARVFVFVDGPRLEFPSDLVSRRQLEELFGNRPGNQSLEVFMSEEHRGLKNSVLDGLDWFFGENPAGLILEDDDFPNDQAVSFLEKQLDLIEGNPRIAQVNLTNHAVGAPGLNAPSFLSSFMHTWGFGLWADSWRGFSSFARSGTLVTAQQIQSSLPGYWPSFYRHWASRANSEMLHQSDTFASTWNVYNFLKKRQSVTPRTSLVSNVGIDSVASNALKVPLIAGFPPIVDHAVNLPSSPTKTAKSLDAYVASTQWATRPFLVRVFFAVVEVVARRTIRKRHFEQTWRALQCQGKPGDVYLTVAQRFYLKKFFE